jgi:hypothetical protein
VLETTIDATDLHAEEMKDVTGPFHNKICTAPKRGDFAKHSAAASR